MLPYAFVPSSLILILFNYFLNNAQSMDLSFQQFEYEYKFERMEVYSVNKAYMKTITVTTYKYNRTCPLVNVTLEYNINAGFDVEIVSQAYAFLSNEYRVFPIRFEINWCDAISKNFGGLGALTKCGNFTGCPIRKGKLYHMCNWATDSSRFPPLIPNGKYMVEGQALYRDTELYVLRAYGTVQRPIPIPKQ